jgi:hypothetical protein
MTYLKPSCSALRREDQNLCWKSTPSDQNQHGVNLSLRGGQLLAAGRLPLEVPLVQYKLVALFDCSRTALQGNCPSNVCGLQYGWFPGNLKMLREKESAHCARSSKRYGTMDERRIHSLIYVEA